MKKNILYALGLLLIAFASCKNQKSEPASAPVTPNEDSLFFQSVWNLDTIPAPMGGWASLSFTPDSQAYFTTFYYDSDDLALTQKGTWSREGQKISAYFPDDTLFLDLDSEKQLTLMSWKEINNPDETANRKYVFQAEKPLELNTLCGDYHSIMDSLITMKITVNDNRKPVVLIDRVKQSPLQFTGQYINNCILLPLSQHFEGTEGYIVIRRNPSDLIDLNVYSPDPKFKLSEKGFLTTDYVK